MALVAASLQDLHQHLFPTLQLQVKWHRNGRSELLCLKTSNDCSPVLWTKLNWCLLNRCCGDMVSKVNCKLPSICNALGCASASASLSLVMELIYVLFYLETIDTKNCLFILGRPVIASSRYIWYNTVTIQTKESRATLVKVSDYYH